jgi:DNA polymerase III subunit delta'
MSRAKKPAAPPPPTGLAPRENPHLVGHEAQRAALAEAAGAGRLAHAWLFAGPAGVGKATLAYRFARWLFAGQPASPDMGLPAADPVFRRVATGAHADFRVLEPEAGERGVKRMIRVDEARAVPRFLAMTAAEGGWRAVLVDEAEAMGEPAQNALLKTLEEPPPRAILILVSAAPDRLLRTIRSRVRRLDFFPLAEAEVAQALAHVLPDTPPAERARLAALADGSPGRAVRLAEGEGIAAFEAVAGVLGAELSVAQQHALAERLAAARDGSLFVAFMEALRREVARAVAEAARGGAAAPWLRAAPLDAWAALWDTLGRLAAETEALNLDRKQAVLTSLRWLADPEDIPA